MNESEEPAFWDDSDDEYDERDRIVAIDAADKDEE